MVSLSHNGPVLEVHIWDRENKFQTCPVSLACKIISPEYQFGMSDEDVSLRIEGFIETLPQRGTFVHIALDLE